MQEYFDLDGNSKDGTFTQPTKDVIDMAALREYCRKAGKRYEDMTQEEIDQFKALADRVKIG